MATAHITMLLNTGLAPLEEQRLAPLDADTWKVLAGTGVTGRCGWVASGAGGRRFLELWNHVTGKCLLRGAAGEVLAASDRDLLDRLRTALGGSRRRPAPPEARRRRPQ